MVEVTPRDLHDLSGRHVTVALPGGEQLSGRVWHVLLTVYGDPTTIILDVPDAFGQDTRVFIPWASALTVTVHP